jgi:phosphoglycerate dehydrogenase-like enzyme
MCRVLNRRKIALSNDITVAVTSRSFSRNDVLKEELLSRYGSVKFNDEGLKLTGNTLLEFLKGCDKAIVGLEKFNRELFVKLPKLKVLSRFGVGLDGMDFKAMLDHGVSLGWMPGVNCLSVAELTLSFMLSLVRNSFFAAYDLKQGHWKKSKGYQLSGKTVGIIGANHVGQEVIRLLKPFNCRILINDIVDQSEYCQREKVEQVAFEDLIQQADIVSLHVPAVKSTVNMINESVFKRMKKTAFLINTARGAVVDQKALKQALMTNEIAGAAVDVYKEEPEEDSEFLSLPNLICTPHIAGNAYEAEVAMGRAAILGLDNAQLPRQFLKA